MLCKSFIYETDSVVSQYNSIYRDMFWPDLIILVRQAIKKKKSK